MSAVAAAVELWRTCQDVLSTCSPPRSASGSTAGWRRSNTRARETPAPGGTNHSCRLEPVRRCGRALSSPTSRDCRPSARTGYWPPIDTADERTAGLRLRSAGAGVAAEQAINETSRGRVATGPGERGLQCVPGSARTNVMSRGARPDARQPVAGAAGADPVRNSQSCSEKPSAGMVMRLRPFCHNVGFQSDSMEAPSVEFSALATAFVVLHDDGRAAKDPVALGELIEAARASGERPGPAYPIVGSRETVSPGWASILSRSPRMSATLPAHSDVVTNRSGAVASSERRRSGSARRRKPSPAGLAKTADAAPRRITCGAESVGGAERGGGPVGGDRCGGGGTRTVPRSR